MKKVLALILVGILVTTLFSGCSKENANVDQEANMENLNLEGFPIVNEKITVSVMGAKHPIHGNWEDLLFFDLMEEKTNIAFEFDTPAWDVFEEKKNLSFTGDAYQEVFYGGLLSKEQQVKYGAQGILIPLEDYIEEYGPNIKAMFEANPGLKKSVTAPDGHIYSLPSITTAPLAMTTAMWLNIEWLDALSVAPEDLPTTVEGLFDLYVRMRDEDPNGNGEKDDIPLSFADKGEGFYNFLPAFGVNAKGAYVDDSGTIKYGYLEDNMVSFLEWSNKLWEEGLVDSDSFTQGFNDLPAKGSQNLIGSAFHAIPNLIYGTTDPETSATYPMAPAFSSSVSSKRATARGTGIASGTFAITDKCRYPEAMMRWVDYQYSEEGSILVHYGPENDLWKMNDKGLREYILPTDGRNVEERRGGEITPDCGLPLPKWVRPDTETSWDDVMQQVRAEQTDKQLWPYAVLPLPEMYFTTEEQKELDILLTDIDKFTSENAAKFITGDSPLNEYDDFIKTLTDMDVDRLVEIYQQAYDRWDSN